MKRSHSKPFACDQCEYACGSRSDLVKHQKKHQEPELFCPTTTCKRSIMADIKKPFRRQDNLDDHIRRVHGPPKKPIRASLELEATDDTSSRQLLKRRRETSPDEEEDIARKNRMLEEQLRRKDAELAKKYQELEKKDQEIKWLKSLVDRVMPGANRSG
jgi:hypothetical protein